MFFAYKNQGETPLEMLERLRRIRPDLKNETLSYAGRLDPMAEGEMLVLVGEENKNYQKYLGFDKEYEATFVCGVATDTGDILGLITAVATEGCTETEIEKTVSSFTTIKKQVYPWFSSKTVNGKKLFEHFREGNTTIERPSRAVNIRHVALLRMRQLQASELQNTIQNAIAKIDAKNDLRQNEIKKKWDTFFETQKRTEFMTVAVRLRVSTGTYIRALTEQFKIPVTLLHLRRTKIFTTPPLEETTEHV